ncbi:MAG: Gfo/Idh/MocA family oxidoreductase [Aureispira sp.]|nr:Gfo/Idh/MocA family oxidoreductase [Aureispira sp.]
MIVKDNIKFAVVGAGHIGKRHATMVQRNPETELVAFCDIRSIEETQTADFGVPLFDTMEAMFAADLDIDVVCICTPNGLHAEHSLKALNAKKHIVCEKPMGLNKADCEQIIFEALNVSRHVFCVMQNRYSPPSVWLKDIISHKRLGDIYMVQINCYWNRDNRYYLPNGQKHPWKGTMELDGGTLFTQFSHFIDIMYWLFGDIKNIQARFSDFTHAETTEFEDSGFVNFEFVHGGMGSLNYSTAVANTNLESSMTIIGEKGSVKVGGQYMNEVEYCNIQNYELPELPPANPANDYGHYKGSAANHVHIIENVADVLKGRKPITTNALEGLKVVEIIEKIYALK